jgi:hypothetical protein
MRCKEALSSFPYVLGHAFLLVVTGLCKGHEGQVDHVLDVLLVHYIQDVVYTRSAGDAYMKLVTREGVMAGHLDPRIGLAALLWVLLADLLNLHLGT